MTENDFDCDICGWTKLCIKPRDCPRNPKRYRKKVEVAEKEK